jgi:hypothetical protein
MGTCSLPSWQVTLGAALAPAQQLPFAVVAVVAVCAAQQPALAFAPWAATTVVLPFVEAVQVPPPLALTVTAVPP